MHRFASCKVVDEILVTITVTSEESCVMSCLKTDDCHSIEVKTDVSVDNCLLYGGTGSTELYVEPSTANSLSYTLYEFPTTELSATPWNCQTCRCSYPRSLFSDTSSHTHVLVFIQTLLTTYQSNHFHLENWIVSLLAFATWQRFFFRIIRCHTGISFILTTYLSASFSAQDSSPFLHTHFVSIDSLTLKCLFFRHCGILLLGL